MRRRGRSGGLRLLKSYSFREKDPIIDAMRTAWSDAGGSYSRMEELSGVAAGTMRGWFSGTTRRPQFATVAAFLRGCGMEGVSFASDGTPRLIGRRRPAHLRVIQGGRRRTG